MSLYDVFGFMTFLVAVAAAAAPGIKCRPGEWYAHLDKPPWTPPDWLFAPVWTVLYFMIAVSGWLVWEAGRAGGVGPETGVLALVVFLLQLVLNGLWSVLFFGLQRPGFAFADILLLLAAILATITLFFPLHPVAAWLLVPYFLWVAFAAGLNYSVWQRNRAQNAAG
jgi:tryptophan-rich sensory protein